MMLIRQRRNCTPRIGVAFGLPVVPEALRTIGSRDRPLLLRHQLHAAFRAVARMVECTSECIGQVYVTRDSARTGLPRRGARGG